VLFLSLAATISPTPAQQAEEAQETAPPPDATAQTQEQDELPRFSPQVILETQKPPKYPPAALAARYTGSVVLETVVLETGKVGSVKVLECTRPKVGFEQAAMDAVKKWRFEPGRVGDRPAEVTLRFRLNFNPGGVSLASEKVPGGTAPAMSTSSSPTSK